MRQDYIYDIKGIRGKLHNIGATWFSVGLFGGILRSTAKSMKNPSGLGWGFGYLGPVLIFSGAGQLRNGVLDFGEFRRTWYRAPNPSHSAMSQQTPNRTDACSRSLSSSSGRKTPVQ